MRLEKFPDSALYNNYSDFPPRQILLVTYVLVRRYEDFEAGRFCRIKQFAVFQLIPPLRSAFLYGMAT
jgi:hypothetical protein